MTAAYEEIVQGEIIMRPPPGARHEMICARLHAAMAASVANLPSVRLLPPRSIVELAPGTMVRPDLTLLTAATGKAWLLAEIIDSGDHSTDTVIKKTLYEDQRVPRVWMVDPRYNNVEIYFSTQYGLSLKSILAGRDVLSENVVKEFQIALKELFAE